MGSISDHPIGEWRRRYRLRDFVETGTFRGDGMIAAIDAGFDRVLSIEADLRMAAAARARIATERPSATFKIAVGPSPHGLRRILPDVVGPAMWWLDAHLPTTFGHSIGATYPLLAEVKSLVAMGVSNDVIVADDMILYGVRVQSPLRRPDPPAPESDLDQIMAMLAMTHEVSIDPRQEGYLVALPRCLT